ncbi:unnamed protein product [Brachionus calyciflorus]|uniref:FAM91A1 n=1 Tax=Brachionus calyciflorus TaxID=104777 RepID=A0A813SWW8_9BILA|nr:unnamed protein product [Brachionus calyciflorus]
MNPEVENQIRNNVNWIKLPTNIKQLIGNSQKEYEKCINNYCIKNQVRYKESLVKHVRKDEKKYYEDLLQYSKENYMLYPYHLSDIFVRGLRITPFNYYLEMMANLMTAEKSYDTLPNFTAFDCVRLLGIGRNQYIDIMNKYRSSNRLRTIGFTRRKPIKTLLPTQPINILIEPWWRVNAGCITDEDVKLLSDVEKICLDTIIDNVKPIEAGKLNFECVHLLYRKGFIYLDVPLNSDEFVEVPPLEGFVMNRITGDYFETLLYKLFVSIDDRTSLGELASLLEIDIDLVLNAVSLYCRLSIAKKKFLLSFEEANFDETWQNYKKIIRKNSKEETLLEWNSKKSENFFDDDLETKTSTLNINTQENNVGSKSPNLKSENNLLLSSPSIEATSGPAKKRIGFLFDSTLTAFLMMGNLSSGLKNHAVTMFEVGKLTDQAIDNFLNELDKVSNESNEGEAQRYFDHALILKSTIQFLRYNTDLKLFSSFKEDENLEKIAIEDEPLGVDLIRCESLGGLDEDSRQRILAKNYSILFSMAPYSSSGDSHNSPPITTNSPFHIGPAIPEMNSSWFKLYLYQLIGDGPGSLLLPKGYRLTMLPKYFKSYEKFLIVTWGHDPIVASHSNLLIVLNDALTHGPILVQCYSDSEDGSQTIHIAFNDTTHPLYQHPSVQKLHEKLSLKNFAGYITMLNPYSLSENGDANNYDDWIFLDLRYGIPLFDNKLNLNILSLLKENNLGCLNNLNSMLEVNRRISLELIDFIQKNQSINIMEDCQALNSDKQNEYFIQSLNNKALNRKTNQSVVLYPTQCILFDGTIQILN